MAFTHGEIRLPKPSQIQLPLSTLLEPQKKGSTALWSTIAKDPLFAPANVGATAVWNNFNLGDTAATIAGQWAVRQTVGPALAKMLGGAAAGPVGLALGGLVGGMLRGLFRRRRRRPAQNLPTTAQLSEELARRSAANTLAIHKAQADAAQNKALMLTNQFIADTLRNVIGSNRYDAQRQGIMTLAVLPELAKAANQAQMNALQQRAGLTTQFAQLDQDRARMELERKLQVAQMNLQAQMAHQQQQAQRQLALANLVLPWIMGGMGLGTKQG